MQNKWLGLLLMCPMICSSAAEAQQATPLSPMPPNEFHFDGEWSCAGSFGNKTAHTSTFTGATVLAGKWLELTEQDVSPSTGYVAKYLIGYDSQRKQLVEFDANNFGAATYTSSEGWQNQVLTMSSGISADAKAPYTSDRFLYGITGKDTFTVDWQISKDASLNWVRADHLACKRQAQNQHS